MALERITITLESEQLAWLDRWVRSSRHGNRSEAIRDLIRARMVEEDPDDAQVVGVVVVTYDHLRRELPDRMVHAAHDEPGLVLATTHLHLDRRHCLEMSALRGQRSRVRAFARELLGMKGVQHGGLLLTRPVPGGD